jgi:hypothetical protein
MNTSGQYVSSQGKLALPLIILAALCLLDQFLNAEDYERPSWLVCLALSFPLGWLASRLGETTAHLIALQHGPIAWLIGFVFASVGTALNIYLLAAFIIWLFRKRGGAHATNVGDDEFRRLLDEHHK